MKLHLGFNSYQVLYKCDNCLELVEEPLNHDCSQSNPKNEIIRKVDKKSELHNVADVIGNDIVSNPSKELHLPEGRDTLKCNCMNCNISRNMKRS